MATKYDRASFAAVLRGNAEEMPPDSFCNMYGITVFETKQVCP